MRSSVVEKAFHDARGVHCCYVAHPQTNAPPREEWVRMTKIGKGYYRNVWAAEELGTGRSLGCHKVHRITKAARSKNNNFMELEIAATLQNKYAFLTELRMLPHMTMCHVGIVDTAGSRPAHTTATVHMERLLDLASWSASAGPQEHAYAMGRVLFLMIQAAHEGVILGDSKAANWACDLQGITESTTKRLVMIDLGGVYFKKLETLGRGEFRAVVERLLVSFPGAPAALVAAGEKWFRHAAADAPGHVPSEEDALQIQYGLVYSQVLLQPGYPGYYVAEALQVSVDAVEAFPEWHDFVAAHEASEPAVAKRNAGQQSCESPQEADERYERELARSLAAGVTAKSFKNYVVQNLEKDVAHGLAVVMGISYTVAKRMLHRREQRKKEGRLHELTDDVRTDPIMTRPKPSAARRLKKNSKPSAKAWAERQKHGRV